MKSPPITKTIYPYVFNVDCNCDIQEVFLAFVKLQRFRACDITDAITTILQNVGLSLSDLADQRHTIKSSVYPLCRVFFEPCSH